MGREKKLASAGRESFVDDVLDMLDEGTGIRELNLRAVAKRVGCAHTNAYNYFASFEELLWWSLRGAQRSARGTEGRSGGPPLAPESAPEGADGTP